MEGYLAEIRLFGGTFAPKNWAFCEGQLLPINSNQALFSLLGCTFGGDCRTTFGLPDLRGRRAIHPGHGPGLQTIQLGEKRGDYQKTMTQAIMPSHSHDIGGSITATIAPKIFNDEAGSEEPDSAYYAIAEGIPLYSSATPDATLGAAEVTVTSDIELANSGMGQPFSKMAPYNAVYYIICTSGIFPSRS